MHSVGQRTKVLRTILGAVPYRRSLYRCPGCGKTLFPGDALLGVEQTSFSPGAQRMMARAGAKDAFDSAAQDLNLYARLKVQRKDVERVAQATGARVEAWRREKDEYPLLQPDYQPQPGEAIPLMYIAFDGTGAPMCPQALAGTKGKQPDGSAKTREVKLGCVFTQTTLDERGRPVREPHSTTYVGAIESSDAFGRRIYAEAVARGLHRAQRVVVLTDGARYNRTIIQTHFPNAIHIIDLYHAREHLSALCKLLLPEKLQQFCQARWRQILDEGNIERLITCIEEHVPRSGTRRKEGLRELKYFQTYAENMRYAQFRQQGLFVGSGVIEAGCRTLIGQRLKKSGMHWSLEGANSIIALRCCLYSGRFEQFWEDQAS
jgi:hypothetical protein